MSSNATGMDASDWMKGIFFSVLASVIGAASKLAIRKSWLMEQQQQHQHLQQLPDSPNGRYTSPLWQDEPEPVARNPNEAMDDSESELPDGPAIAQADDKPNSRRHLLLVNNSSEEDEEEDDDDNPHHNVLQSTLHTTHTTTNNKCCCCLTLSQLLRFAGMIGMSLLNPACSLVAMNYASPSILAPFSGLTLVWVICLSPCLISESPSCAQKVASALIVVGEVMVAVFGDHTNDDGATIDSVKASYLEPAFCAYFVGLALWMVLLTYWIQARYAPMLRRFAWGTSGGSVTGLAQCFIKDSLVVLKASPNKWAMPWFEYLFIPLGIACSFGGLLFLSACMKRYDATYSAAMFVGSFVVSTSIMSALHYHTFAHLADVTDLIMYPLGLIVLMMGVGILVQRGTQASHSTTESSSLPEPRTNRAYSDVYHPDSPDDDQDAATPVVMIPPAIPETTLTERSNTGVSGGDNRGSGDELELI